MTLPEPAATIWREHRQAIQDLAERPDGRRSRLILGGGTVMAARLGHRASTDIDVFFPDLEDLVEGSRGGERDLARATKGERLVDDEKQIKVKVRGGEIDAIALTPHFNGSEEIAEIDGELETVLTNAQILRGKLERTNRSITRDAFDFATAAKLDPRSLEIAVNAIDKKTCTNICGQIESHSGDYARDIREGTALYGVPTEVRENPDTLAQHASSALRSHRYRRLAIELTDDALEITTERQGRDPRTETYSRRNVENGLLRSGALDHIASNWNIGRTRLRHDIGNIADTQWKGTVIDTEWGEPRDDLARATREAAQCQPRTDPPGTPEQTDRNNPAETDDQRSDATDGDSDRPDLEPPSRKLLAGKRIDHADDMVVTRENAAPSGKTATDARNRATKTPSKDTAGGHRR